MAEIKRPIEEEPAYKLGQAINIIQSLLGKDRISLESETGKNWVKKHARGWAENFLKKEGYQNGW